MSSGLNETGSTEPILVDGDETLYEVVNKASNRVFLTFNVRNIKKLLLGETTKSIVDYPIEDYDRQTFLKYQLKTIL